MRGRIVGLVPALDSEPMTTSRATVNPARLRAQQLKKLDRESFDVAIIGGGIYGAMLLLHAAANGLKTVLLERGDFGAETSFNSLRILHGGLRYLQSLDLRRSRESIGEQGWFLREFPDLVRPLPCLLPLYNQGLRRPFFMRLAFGLDRLVSIDRKAGLAMGRQLPPARIINSSETMTLFPQVAVRGLAAGAIWHDAAIPDTQRLVMEVLNWARAQGGVAYNYLDVTDISIDDSIVRGVAVRDLETGERRDIAAKVVVNATGPGCEDLASRFDATYTRTTYPSVAWNVLFNREALSDYALGVTIPGPNSHVYFLHPWKGRLLAGTGHEAAQDSTKSQVDDLHLNRMIADLNRAIPGLNLSTSQIQRVMSGILPVREAGSTDLSKRPIMHDHGASGGPHGLVSVSGVKLGASRIVAENTVRTVIRQYFGDRHRSTPQMGDRPGPRQGWQQSARQLGRLEDENSRAQLLQIIESEMVLHLDDLFLRRTTLWEDPSAAMRLAPQLLALFDWDARQIDDELNRLRNALEPAT
jgi:glycerol-3-phosphate dehydrogenase